MYSVEDRKEAKRAWRKATNMQVTIPTCFTCKLFQKFEETFMKGFCWKMAHDLGLDIKHCHADATSMCDEYIPNE